MNKILIVFCCGFSAHAMQTGDCADFSPQALITPKQFRLSCNDAQDYDCVPQDCIGIIFHARGRLIGDLMIGKRAELERAKKKKDQQLIAKLEREIEELNKQTIQFAREQQEWLIDLAFKKRQEREF